MSDTRVIQSAFNPMHWLNTTPANDAPAMRGEVQGLIEAFGSLLDALPDGFLESASLLDDPVIADAAEVFAGIRIIGGHDGEAAQEGSVDLDAQRDKLRAGIQALKDSQGPQPTQEARADGPADTTTQVFSSTPPLMHPGIWSTLTLEAGVMALIFAACPQLRVAAGVGLAQGPLPQVQKL